MSEFRYGVRRYEEDVSVYDVKTVWFDDWESARKFAEASPSTAWVDEFEVWFELVEVGGEVVRMEQSELTDLYAEFDEGVWAIDGASCDGPVCNTAEGTEDM